MKDKFFEEYIFCLKMSLKNMVEYHALPRQKNESLTPLPLSKWQHEDEAWLKLADVIRKECDK